MNDNQTNDEAYVASLAASKNPPVLLGVLGSTAYGMATATSDLDRIGVYVANTKSVLGLQGARVVDTTLTTKAPEPDLALHELGKFVGLALKCNPTILELLYVKDYDICTEVGAQLVALRRSFLSERCIREAFGGYANQQLHKIVRAGSTDGDGVRNDHRTEKHGRHCFRLLRSGVQLLTTGEIILDVGDDRDEIFAMGELAVSNLSEFSNRFLAALAAFDALDSVVGDTPDFKAAEKFVVKARLAQL